MHPDELLEQLKATANPRKQRNLDIINAVCREQYERGSKDFSVATIARIAEERGGPVKGTIHNKTGDDFKGLIKAWAEHTGGLTRKVRKVSENPYEALIEKIENPATRAVMASVLAENRKLRSENTLLKSSANLILDLRPQACATTGNAVQVLPASTELTESEIEALQHAVSKRFLDDEGWKEDDHGRILQANGRPLFKVGFTTGIRKIVGDDRDTSGMKPGQCIGVAKGKFEVSEETQ